MTQALPATAAVNPDAAHVRLLHPTNPLPPDKNKEIAPAWFSAAPAQRRFVARLLLFIYGDAL